MNVLVKKDEPSFTNALLPRRTLLRERSVLISIWLFFLAGCLRSSPNEVVVYVALDREFSEPILKDLESELQMTMLVKYDQESNKTVGLVNDILQNQTRPRGDVFWNNEIMHTLRLQQLGLLEVYLSPSAQPFPARFVAPDQTWYGFAARGRILIINTDWLPDPDLYPRSIFDLANPKWKDRCGMAKPLLGTTATHAAVLFEHLGTGAAEKLMREIRNNAVIEGGNKTVATRVANGQYAWGLTDTDDAIIELELGRPVAIVFPDQEPDQIGALMIPNTLCLIKNGPNSERAKKLVDRLLQPDIEARLAVGRSAQIPLNPRVPMKSRALQPGHELKTMEVDFVKVASHWEDVAKRLQSIFR
jgi:iron(III) transport system substrate-binding protein